MAISCTKFKNAGAEDWAEVVEVETRRPLATVTREKAVTQGGAVLVYGYKIYLAPDLRGTFPADARGMVYKGTDLAEGVQLVRQAVAAKAAK